MYIPVYGLPRPASRSPSRSSGSEYTRVQVFAFVIIPHQHIIKVYKFASLIGARCVPTRRFSGRIWLKNLQLRLALNFHKLTVTSYFGICLTFGVVSRLGWSIASFFLARLGEWHGNKIKFGPTNGNDWIAWNSELLRGSMHVSWAAAF